MNKSPCYFHPHIGRVFFYFFAGCTGMHWVVPISLVRTHLEQNCSLRSLSRHKWSSLSVRLLCLFLPTLLCIPFPFCFSHLQGVGEKKTDQQKNGHKEMSSNGRRGRNNIAPGVRQTDLALEQNSSEQTQDQIWCQLYNQTGDQKGVVFPPPDLNIQHWFQPCVVETPLCN